MIRVPLKDYLVRREFLVEEKYETILDISLNNGQIITANSSADITLNEELGVIYVMQESHHYIEEEVIELSSIIGFHLSILKREEGR